METPAERPALSVVIPAYNEEKRIAPTVERVWEYLRDRPGGFEVIVVDDGSSDGTAAVVRGYEDALLNVRLLGNAVNMGKGAAIKKGVLASRGETVLISDADLSTPIEEVEKLVASLDGADIVVGSRGLRESDVALRQPWYRERMGKTFNLFVRLLVVGGLKDTQCGFKLFRGDAARRVFALSRVHGFSFDVEALFIAKKLGYRVKEVPVRWLNSPASRVSLLRDPLKMFADLFRIRLNGLRGLYRP